jgi:hypothetical protein
MTQPLCAVCGQRMLWTSAFLIEQDVLMHARCSPPLAGRLERGDEVPPKSVRERITSTAAP